MLPKSQKGLHRHHIIPKHMGGKDTPSNIVFLTPEEHAEAHRKLWESHGNQEDYIAWKSLCGQMTKEEATRNAIINSNKTRVVTDETRRKIGEKSKNRKSKLGYKTPDVTKKKISESVKKTFKEKDYRKSFRHTYQITFLSGETLTTQNLKEICESRTDLPSYGTIRQQLSRGKTKWKKKGPYMGLEVVDLTKTS